MNEKPFLVPEMALRMRTAHLADMHLSTAIIAFMPPGPIAKRFSGDLLPARVFTMARKQWLGKGIQEGIILVGPVHGGPDCDNTVEELSVLGIRYVIGIGI